MRNVYEQQSELILNVFERTRTSSSLIRYKYDRDVNLIAFSSLVINTCRRNVFIYDLVCNIKYFFKNISLCIITLLLMSVDKFK